MQSAFPQSETPQERIGFPCSKTFHEKIEAAVIELRNKGAIVDMSRFASLGMANALQYALINRDDFAAVIAWQTIYPRIGTGLPAECVYTASLPSQLPHPCDYAVQIAAFYFAFTHEIYGQAFKRLLNPSYRQNVLQSQRKWRAAVRHELTSVVVDCSMKKLEELQRQHEKKLQNQHGNEQKSACNTRGF